MSDSILSDLIGERVQVLPESSISIYLPFEGVVRGILATLALIIEDNNGRISVRSFENNTFTRVGVRVVAIGGPSTVRSLKVGDAFKFKKPPPGWTSGNLLVVDKFPGYAAPEGWDYFPIELLDGEIEPVNEPFVAVVRRHTGAPHQVQWRPLYASADVEECLGCTLQRRKIGTNSMTNEIDYQYRDSARPDWHS